MLLVVSLLALAGPVAGLTQGEIDAALRGEVPVRTEQFTTASGQAAGRGLGAIVIERPVETVWATVSHYDDRAEYIPRLEKVTVLERQPDRLRVRQEVDASITTARYTGWYRLDAGEHAVRWKLDPTAGDNTIRDTEGEYRLFEVSPSRTLLVYRSYVDSGRAVPRSIQEYIARRAVPDLLHAIKKRVESGGTWKKR
jgi:hypothetical protein